MMWPVIKDRGSGISTDWLLSRESSRHDDSDDPEWASIVEREPAAEILEPGDPRARIDGNGCPVSALIWVERLDTKAR